MPDIQPGEIVQINSHKRIIFAIMGIGIVFLIIVVVLIARRTNSNPAVSTSVNSAGDHLVLPAQDTDHDGLSDAEETALGTRIDVADTDGDGLDDVIEVKTSHTDPKNSHSQDQILTDLEWLLQHKSVKK